MTNVDYGKLTTRLIAGWFMLVLGASALHIFRAGPSQLPLAVGLAVLVPLAVFLSWFGVSRPFRRFALALNPRILTLVQAWRIAGFVFLVLYTYGILPGIFALPAGWGDIAVGATAPLVASRLANRNHRRGFILWQVLGISDLVIAVTLGATANFIRPNGISTSAITALPLSLIPTFAVPMLLILHIICVAQARRWNEEQQVHLGKGWSPSAAAGASR